MKCFSEKLAVVLMVAVMACSFNFSGWAASSDYWELNDDNTWNYWRNGEMVMNKMLTINKISYFFKEDGAMASDETFEMYDNPNGQDVVLMLYAFPEGRLAKNFWVHLNDEGHLVPNAQEGDWYYFDKNGNRLQNENKRINGEMYYFNEDGKMLSETFIEDEKKFYYEHGGQRAEDKWLNIEDNWYSFKEDGSCRTASDSNAQYEFDDEGILVSDKTPCPTIDSIELNGHSERTAVIGEELKVNFDVRIASASDAVEQKLTKNHDFWIEESGDSELLGTYTRKLSTDYIEGKSTISYTPLAPDTVQFKIVIDGIESDPVTVTSNWGENADVEKSNAVDKLLSSMLNNDGIFTVTDVTNSVASIKTYCEDLGDNNQIKKTWIKQIGVLENLDDLYAMANRNLISSDTTEVTEILGAGDAKLIGASLNANQGDTIKLLAAKGDSVSLPEAFEKQVSIELNLYNNDNEISSLDIPVIVTLPVPKGMSTTGLKVFHMGADGIPELLDTKIEGNKISLVTDSFSNFVFAGKAEGSNSGNGGNSSGGSSSGRSGSTSVSQIPETPGTWTQLANGKWQFNQPDGTPYLNTWAYVKGHWYWLDATGMMTDGWQNINEKRYYLTPVNGNMIFGWLQSGTSWYYLDETGAMRTGWVHVNGKWYYLDTDGIMLSNATTPDGYKVDETGARTN